MQDIVTLREIEDAEKRIRSYIRPTPLEYSAHLSSYFGKEVYLKLEVFQPIRVFKIRGALSKITALDQSSLNRGVITASSGNHGLAVAYVSRLLGINATICVPTNANQQKVRAIREQGAKIVKVGRNYDEAYKRAVELSKRKELTFVHAFDDREVIAGQGTCGLEIHDQIGDLDAIIVPIGGGGLISGIAAAIKEMNPKVTIYGVQSKAVPSMYKSLVKGRRTFVRAEKTIADGMQASIPGELTFRIVSKYVKDIALVSDRQIKDAIYDLLLHSRIIAEPAGASPLAALRSKFHNIMGRKVVLIISGGNISLQLLSEIISKKLRRGNY